MPIIAMLLLNKLQMILKTRGFNSIALFAAAGLMTTNCNYIKKMNYQVTPDPLEMHGDSVRMKVEIQLPEKSFNKKIYAELQPSLGEHKLNPITIVGEKATANGVVIPFKPGKTIVYTDVVAYEDDMEVTELTVEGDIYKKGKNKGEIEKQKLADATIITPLLVNKDFRVIFSEDNFERITPEKQIAEINYLKDSPIVRRSEMSDDDIVALDSFLAVAQENPKIDIKSIDITAFASIEGEEDRNNTLSNNRAASAQEATIKVAKRKKVANEVAQDESSYSLVGKGEDYEGFKRALADADMEESDKRAIMTILEMQKSPEAREQAIRDLSTYLYLDNNVFPAQRRSEIVVNYDLVGYSDEELVQISQTNIDMLNVEEILFTATLTDDLDEKLRLYNEAERLFPEDYRPANNVGVVLYMQEKIDEAKAQFEKASQIEESKETKNNLAAISGLEGERSTAHELLDEANGAGDEVSYNRGILNIQDGDYKDAVSNFGSESTYNKALAQVLDGDSDGAISTINDSQDANTAQGLYLKAIASARKDKINDVVANLKDAFAKDSSLKAKAAKDREFLKYAEEKAFTSIVM
jgi:tetratricopeptide (TPR) repeat protein